MSQHQYLLIDTTRAFHEFILLGTYFYCKGVSSIKLGIIVYVVYPSSIMQLMLFFPFCAPIPGGTQQSHTRRLRPKVQPLKLFLLAPD